ncbi:glycosyltransferase family 2 protein [Slackia exigua]|uniref:Glycosyltransferase, group 2 family protein n=1 Tax=Slackia exigua (strain ATCC 700122 / DSM 15923 / CIP 105133 / JCM 11022 / KCTC 5966 / S-7) TaxID=649764 RepID=D0WID5_SLAES|nr:glycosyltransferase [Slackia exigua]EEZ60802.1 glycosyltransferase, group 2 family protein [Slackia exigua ATCC 700122]STN99989.1 Chondroitin polymerase [Slackia exigua]
MDVSIVIPVYNVKDYLIECLNSVDAGFGSLEGEVLIIDDGSTDGSSELAKNFADEHPRFRYVKIVNQGVAHARNLGAARVTGKYLQFVDSDDIVEPGLFEKLFRVAERYDADVTVCDVVRTTDGKISASDIHVRAFAGIKGTVTSAVESPSLAYDSLVMNKLIRRAYYEEQAFQFPEGMYFEDIPVAFALDCKANRVAVVRSIGYRWRIRTSGASTTQSFANRKNLTDKIAMIERLMSWVDAEVGDAGVRRAVELKALTVDFTVYLNAMNDFSDEQAADYVDLIAGFVERNIAPERLREVQLKERQVFHDVLARDVDHLRRVVNYKRANYATAPIVTSGEAPVMVLSSDIFTIPDRDAGRELENVPPRCQVDAVETGEGKMVLRGHLYTRRISMPNVGDQRIRAWLYNEESGERRELPAKPIEFHTLTVEQGTMVNCDDYRTYRYNYDGTGFEISLDFFALGLSERFMGANFVILGFENRFFAGECIVRGARKAAKAKAKGFAADVTLAPADRASGSRAGAEPLGGSANASSAGGPTNAASAAAVGDFSTARVTLSIGLRDTFVFSMGEANGDAAAASSRTAPQKKSGKKPAKRKGLFGRFK